MTARFKTEDLRKYQVVQDIADLAVKALDKIRQLEKLIDEHDLRLQPLPIERTGTSIGVRIGSTIYPVSVVRAIEAAHGITEQPARWAVFCGICSKEWSVLYQHPGKSVCTECEAAYGSKGAA